MEELGRREGYWYSNGSVHFLEVTVKDNNRISSRFEGIVIGYEGNEFNLMFRGAIRYLRDGK